MCESGQKLEVVINGDKGGVTSKLDSQGDWTSIHTTAHINSVYHRFEEFRLNKLSANKLLHCLIFIAKTKTMQKSFFRHFIEIFLGF